MEGEDFEIVTFKSEFQQVILNLIITLNASTIIFEDNGGGIEESILERIFWALLYYQRES